MEAYESNRSIEKALKEINFGKNAVLLSIGANDYETEKAVSESFENNELIIATDIRGYDTDIPVNSHLLVLKEKIDAENFTINDFNNLFGNDNYKYKHGKPYVIYDRLSALWYSLYKGKTHITKKILIYLIFSKPIICCVLGYTKRRIRNDD